MVMPGISRLGGATYWIAVLLGVALMGGLAEAPALAHSVPTAANEQVLDADNFRHHVDRFNAMENENVINLVPNAGAWEWMKENVPTFACPDPAFEEIYWYRWWTYRKHIHQFPDFIGVTEFLTKNPV